MSAIKFASSKREVNCWAKMEDLGGMIWMMNHELCHGNIDKKDVAEVEKDIAKMAKLQKEIAEEIHKKFNVVFPEGKGPLTKSQDLPPLSEGKIYYSDWYYKMQREERLRFFDRVICSGCPFGTDTEYEGSDMCEYNVGDKEMDGHPLRCGAVATYHDPGFKNIEDFYGTIIKKYGYKALAVFLRKFAKLLRYYDLERERKEKMEKRKKMKDKKKKIKSKKKGGRKK